MILECPKCKKRYLVDPRAVGTNGRTVRCANCANQWFATPPPPESVTLALEEPVRPPKEAKPAEFPVPAIARDISSTPLSLKLSTAVLAILVMLTGMVLFRDRVVSMVPALEKIYAKVGAYETDGVVLAELAYTKEAIGLKDQHQFSGYFVNTTKEPRQLPKGSIRLMDDEGRILQNLPMISKEMMKPGEKKVFNRKESTSPGSVSHIVVELGSPLELKLRR